MKPGSHHFHRRDFLRYLAAAGATTFIPAHLLKSTSSPGVLSADKPATNIDDALKAPRTADSMPGKYPGRVIEAYNAKAAVNGKPDLSAIQSMVERCMLELTGAPSLKEAWLQFVTPQDVIGLKVNPVAGKLLSTSLEIVKAVIAQLEAAGIPRKNLVIWDRREFEMHEVGFTRENFPGVRITGPECKDENGSFYNAEGKLYGEARIDKDWYFWADCEDSYDEETLPYMINEGKYSYFSKVVTGEVTKIINIPILKNAGPTVTLCLKNLAYGSITNTARLHKQLWSETTAQVPCFPPLRDKVVLNLVDGIIGCYQGGPGANPQFITAFNTVLAGTDPVAVDRVGYDIMIKKRFEQKVQKKESPRALVFANLAESYKLGVAALEKIDRSRLVLG